MIQVSLVSFTLIFVWFLLPIEKPFKISSNWPKNDLICCLVFRVETMINLTTELNSNIVNQQFQEESIITDRLIKKVKKLCYTKVTVLYHRNFSFLFLGQIRLVTFSNDIILLCTNRLPSEDDIITVAQNKFRFFWAEIKVIFWRPQDINFR